SSRRRHTRFSRDWSSDVCSSDLSGMESSQISIIQHDESFIITTDDALRVYSHLLAPITRLSQPLLEQQSALLLICACTHMLGGDIAAQGGKQMFRLTLQFTAGSQAQRTETSNAEFGYTSPSDNDC